MSLKIRLARGGAKKRPVYRVVVADARSPRDGRFLEKLGTFNPLKAKDAADRVVIDLERAAFWLSKGAQPTDRVAKLLSVHGLVKWENGNNPTKGAPGKKAQERVAERKQKAEEAQAAAEAAVGDAAAVAADNVAVVEAAEMVAEGGPVAEAAVDGIVHISDEAQAAETLADTTVELPTVDAPAEAAVAEDVAAEEPAAE